MWGSSSRNAGLVMKIELICNVSQTWLLLGGEFLLMVYEDGKPEVQSLEHCGVVLIPFLENYCSAGAYVAYSSRN